MPKIKRFSKTCVLTLCVVVTYILVFNIFTLYHLSNSRTNSFVHSYGFLYLGHLNAFRNWTCKPVGLSKVQLPLTALASYPGSGNTWLRHLLQQSTGISTGSEYVDLSLKLRGFAHEGISNNSVLVVKTHEFGIVTLNKYERAVLLIRKPEDALLAEFNRRYGGHLGFAQRLNFQKDWNSFVFDELERWHELNLRWLNFPRPLHVILYDQLKRNTTAQVVSLLNFFEIQISNKELLCVIRNAKGHFKRVGSKVKTNQGKDLYTFSEKRTMATYWNNLLQLVKKRHTL